MSVRAGLWCLRAGPAELWCPRAGANGSWSTGGARMPELRHPRAEPVRRAEAPARAPVGANRAEGDEDTDAG
ncbi:hypothetical protein, partial [Streptomyces aureus]|uniref:hypothetical protein n=1 Tax=Streptomyces aureus TaxID=193461 RepID=UPI003474667F